MKKVILSLAGFAISAIAFAQDNNGIPPVPPTPENLEYGIAKSVETVNNIRAVAPIIVVALFVLLLTTLTKHILDYRLKNKIIDKGISDELATSILERNTTNKSDESIKWTLLLLGVGAGLIISYYTMPLHIHSLAIMAFSIAASYLGYFFYLKNQNK